MMYERINEILWKNNPAEKQKVQPMINQNFNCQVILLDLLNPLLKQL